MADTKEYGAGFPAPFVAKPHASVCLRYVEASSLTTTAVYAFVLGSMRVRLYLEPFTLYVTAVALGKVKVAVVFVKYNPCSP